AGQKDRLRAGATIALGPLDLDGVQQAIAESDEATDEPARQRAVLEVTEVELLLAVGQGAQPHLQALRRRDRYRLVAELGRAGGRPPIFCQAAVEAIAPRRLRDLLSDVLAGQRHDAVAQGLLGRREAVELQPPHQRS